MLTLETTPFLTCIKEEKYGMEREKKLNKTVLKTPIYTHQFALDFLNTGMKGQ